MQLTQESVGQVFELLKGAQSNDVRVQQDSEAALKRIESTPGYASCLAAILASKQADHSARWMAAIQLKNVVSKQWRARVKPGTLTEEEKNHLRGVLLQLIDQENQQLAVPIAVAFAKVARAEYPRVWPTLLQDILALMQSGVTLQVRRCFLVLHHIIKELASMRLPADKRNFEAVAKMLMGMYSEQWYKDTSELANGLPQALQNPQQPNPLMLVFERWFLELKGLRRMLLFGIASDAKTFELSPAVSEIAGAALQALQVFHAARPKNVTMRAQVHAMLDRALQKLSKCLHDLQESHPWAIYSSGNLKASTEFFGGVLTEPPQSSPAYESFLMQAMIYLNDSQLCPAYKEDALKSIHETHPNQVQQITEMSRKVRADVAQLWQSGLAKNLCQSLIQYHLLLTVKELQEWAHSPEEFHHQTGTVVWQDSIRGCSETLFTLLMEGHKEQSVPVVLDILRLTSEEGASTSGRNDEQQREGFSMDVLMREAAYNAAALGVWSLMDSLDFSQWLHSTLLQVLGDSNPKTKPLRRRAAILTSAWVVKLKPRDRPPVYRAMLGVMGDEDVAISLTGFLAMRGLLEDWEFEEEPFLEFVEPCFRVAAEKLQLVDDYESQIQIFNLLNSILDRLEKSVKPYLGPFVLMIPEIWTESKSQSLLRIQILLALQRTVNSLGLDSPIVYPIVLSILKECFDPQQEDALNLLEDSLHLWLIVLRNAPQPDPQLFAPFPRLEQILKDSTEHVEVSAAIMLSAVVLGSSLEALGLYGTHVSNILSGLIGHLAEKGMRLILPVMDVILQVFPEHGPQILWNPLLALLQDLLSGKEYGIVIAAGLNVFARLLIVHREAFLSLMSSNQASPDSQTTSDAFMRLWLDHFDSLSNAAARKLSALALCSLLQLPLPSIPQHLTTIVSHVTAVWYETEDESANGSETRMNLYPQLRTNFPENATVNSEEAEGEFRRLQAIHERDIVRSAKLSEVGKQSLAGLMQAQAAQGASQSALHSLPPELQTQLNTLIQS